MNNIFKSRSEQRYIKVIIFLLVFQIPLVIVVGQTGHGTKNRLSGMKDFKGYKNIVKVNTLATPFKNLSLSYERVLWPRISGSMGLGYKFAGREPKVLSSDNFNITFEPESITGISATPEMRYYFRPCEPGAADGFYVGGYLRFSRYTTGSKFTYKPFDQEIYHYTADFGMNEYGMGLQLGYMLVIRKRFVVDFMFLGPRYSRHFAFLNFKSQISDQFLEDLNNYFNEIMDRFGLDYTLDIKRENIYDTKASFGFANMRFGISVGYSF